MINLLLFVFSQVTNLTPNQAAAQAIQLFSQEARLCDRTQPNKVARTSLEPGPASLAKRLPVKSINPTCSIEGIASKSGLSRSPSNNKATRLESKVCPLDDVSERESSVQPARIKQLTTRNKRKSACTCLEGDSKKIRGGGSNSPGLKSSISRDAVRPVEKLGLAKIIEKRASCVPNPSYKNTNTRSIAPIRGRKGTGNKGRNGNGGNKSSRSRVKKRGNRSSQSFVRELLVLALYLRYLEAKRYSKTRGGRSDHCVLP